MMETCRKDGWLGVLHGVVVMMTTMTSKKWEKYKDEGAETVVPQVSQILRERWLNAASMTVVTMVGKEGVFMVTEPVRAGDSGGTGETCFHLVDIIRQSCTCGIWQEHRYPCTHGVAYYRLYAEKSFRHILEENVSELYKHRSLQGLYGQAMMPVVLAELRYDGETKPPPVKKTSGRPKVNRYRQRSKYIDPSESTVKCSTCGEKGHNRRTCGRQKRRPDELQITEEQPTEKKRKGGQGAPRKRPPNEVQSAEEEPVNELDA